MAYLPAGHESSQKSPPQCGGLDPINWHVTLLSQKNWSFKRQQIWYRYQKWPYDLRTRLFHSIVLGIWMLVFEGVYGWGDCTTGVILKRAWWFTTFTALQLPCHQHEIWFPRRLFIFFHTGAGSCWFFSVGSVSVSYKKQPRKDNFISW